MRGSVGCFNWRSCCISSDLSDPRLLEQLLEKEREYQAILQQVLEEREQEIRLLRLRSEPAGLCLSFLHVLLWNMKDAPSHFAPTAHVIILHALWHEQRKWSVLTPDDGANCLTADSVFCQMHPALLLLLCPDVFVCFYCSFTCIHCISACCSICIYLLWHILRCPWYSLFISVGDIQTSSPETQKSQPAVTHADSELTVWLRLNGADQDSIDRVSAWICPLLIRKKAFPSCTVGGQWNISVVMWKHHSPHLIKFIL